MTRHADRPHRVELASWERVVERGRAQVNWFVRSAGGWVAAQQWPEARAERLDPGPGTVWESRVELELHAGTELMRVESRPLPYERLKALDFLARERRKPARRVVRTYYRVGPRGELLRSS